MSARRTSYGRVHLSHPEKVLFPDAGITKQDLFEHYVALGEEVLRHARGRPLSLQRFPDGIEGQGFYQKQVPGGTPDWVHRVTVPTRQGRQEQITAEDVSTLAWLADQACITPHVWPSREGSLDRPDRMIFDLDPSNGGGFDAVRDAARRVRDALAEADLVSFVQTTGSRGLHVVVPLTPDEDHDVVRAFARRLAEALAERHPDALTVAARKEKRGSRLYLDVMRNARGQTFVAPYAVRARPGAPVATPLDWDEVDDADLDPRAWRVDNIRRRVGAKGDPWKGIGRRARHLDEDRRGRVA